MPSEKELLAKIGELETELAKKEQEIISHLDRIEQLEDQIMRLEAMIPDEGDKKGKKGKDSKLLIELEEKDRTIRELKDKLGYLRKEKIRLQQELEKMSKKSSQGSVIRIEEKKTPLDSLVNELQTKINKQRLLITKLKQQAMSADAAELAEKIREKDEKIRALNEKIEKLEKELKTTPKVAVNKMENSVSRSLMEELQTKLNKARIQIKELKRKLSKKEKKGKKEKVEVTDKDELYEKIDELKEKLENKDKKIRDLEEKLKTSEDIGKKMVSKAPISALTEELQTKLNKAKIQIKSLEEQLAQYKKGEIPVGAPSQENVEKELEIQKELVISLQQQIEEHKKQLEQKHAELTAVKTESIQHKLKCEDLENLIKIKDQKIEELTQKLKAAGIMQPKAPSKSLNTELRIRELKSLVEELTKQNIQQRLELSRLREL